MLYLIGIGLGDEKDITVRGLEILRSCDIVYLENYTSKMNATTIALQKFFEKPIILANREFVEKNAADIIYKAEKMNVALLIAGDPLSATTHIELLMRARENNIPAQVIHNASILTAVGETGLQLYKFGKVTSIPFREKNFKPEAFYDILLENKKISAHTLMLLDIKAEENMFMTANEAIRIIFDIEEKRGKNIFNEDTFCVVGVSLGTDKQKIFSGTAGDLKDRDFGMGLQCLIVPGKMHFLEEEFLKLYSL